jgi:hypothetical protein
MQYYARAGLMEHINIDLEDSDKRVVDELITDRWNQWIFTVSSSAEIQKEARQNEYALNFDATARRITDEWKTLIASEYEINTENYYDDGEHITNRQDNKNLSADIIKSLTDKWSAAIFTKYTSRTFLNVNHNLGASVGVEYNFFPWSESNRRVFSIRYMAGYDYFEYRDSTIYEKIRENLVSEALSVNLDLIQPWGEISVGIVGSHFFHDFSKNRLTFESDVSVRLSKNLSVFCEFQTEIIHDQLYLPKGGASLEDLLLRRRKLATTYEIQTDIGFRFTFGSIYNNAVNERF